MYVCMYIYIYIYDTGKECSLDQTTYKSKYIVKNPAGSSVDIFSAHYLKISFGITWRMYFLIAHR